MKSLRILFTGIGRRVELVQAFRQAALALSVDLKVYGVDMSETAPALAYCDFRRKTCGMKEEGYISELLRICEDDHVDLLIPTIDTDLLFLAATKEKFEAAGTKVLVSNLDKVFVCRDKSKTADFFCSCGLAAPDTVTDSCLYQGAYPCFIKPKDGSSSINAFKIEDAHELSFYAEKLGQYIIQPFIDGTEHTVDMMCDFDGNPITIVPRIRIAVRSGEVLKTRIALDRRIIEACRKIAGRFKPCGPITVQLIREKGTGTDWYIEINPRFGGGAPLSMKAGADSAGALLRMLMGETVGYREVPAADESVYSRFDQSVCIRQGKSAGNIKGVIFDLDDTLYSEKEYVKSGYRAVADYMGDRHLADKLWEYFLQGMPAISALLEETGGDLAECLKIYRSHIPEIHLYDGVQAMLEKLRRQGIRTGIITDGRPEGQRNKLRALGLERQVDDIIVTDELGGEVFRKPCDIAFRILQRKWRLSFGEMAYVGDNSAKDFYAPVQLGMLSVWFENLEGLYSGTQYAFMGYHSSNFKEILQYVGTQIRQVE